MIHSRIYRRRNTMKVVNWFQIDTFMWWFTVDVGGYISPDLLWIDFKLILLCDDSQSQALILILIVCCELISNWYFYVMIHSRRLTYLQHVVVVNWFQIDTFMWWFTVSLCNLYSVVQLWIDFKLILLCDDSQSKGIKAPKETCCELISNWYFYVMIHSM